MFKLTEQIVVDDLSEMEYFKFERHVMSNGVKPIETFQCKLIGIHQKRHSQKGNSRSMKENRNQTITM